MQDYIGKDRRIFVFMPEDGEIKHTPNFRMDEFFCKCRRTHPHFVSLTLIETLQQLRDELGVPLKINSGYRCPEHNRKIGGAKASQHMRGLAADVAIPDGIKAADIFDIARYKCGFSWGYEGKGFVHLDLRIETTDWRWK